MMVILNIVLLNVLWFACVLGASNGLLWPAVACLFVLLMVTYIYEDINKKDFQVIVFSLLFGGIIDGFLHASGLLVYASPFHQLSYLPPVWILFLWIGFAASIKIGMKWFLDNPILGVLVMTIGSPLSYFSASKLGAVQFGNMPDAMIVIALGWMLYFICITQIFYTKGSNEDVLV